MAEQFKMIKVAIEIHEDNWNDDLQVLIYNGDKLVGEYDYYEDMEVIEVSANLITDIKEA
tara:strand:+ start:1736 stop:1915 length:180 start_codon:yes stop_codon:yes gene_type:complete